MNMFVPALMLYLLLLIDLCYAWNSHWTVTSDPNLCNSLNSVIHSVHYYTHLGCVILPANIHESFMHSDSLPSTTQVRWFSNLGLQGAKEHAQNPIRMTINGSAYVMTPSCYLNATHISASCSQVALLYEPVLVLNTAYGEYVFPSKCYACFQALDETVETVPAFNFSALPELKKRLVSVTFTYKDNILKVFPSTEGVLFEVSVVSDTIENKACNGTCSLELPGNWTRDYFFVYVYEDGYLIAREEIAYRVPESCHVAHCFWCKENFETFNCLSYGNKVAIIVSIVFGGALVLLSILMLSVMIKAMLKLPSNQAMMLAVILIPLVSACDTNLIISGQQVDCVITGNVEECKIVTQSLVTLPYLGSKICLTVLNEESNLVMGFVNISFVQSFAVAGLNLDYWTSNREIVSSSAKWCAGTEHCSASTNCATPRSASDKPDMGGALDGPATVYPGVSRCSDGCGCAGCNCFSCAEACVYQRYGVVPVPSVWKVQSVVTSRLVPRIQACYGSTSGESFCDDNIFINGNTKTIGGNFTMTYIGSFQTSFNFFGKKILSDETGAQAYFVEAAQKNVPVAGMPGEIQANDPNSLKQPTLTSFIMASDICDPYISDSAGFYDCVAPPLGGVVNEQALPMLMDGVYWSYSSDGSLVGDVINPPGLSLSMLTEGSVIFKTTRVQVCPWLEFLSISGEWGSPVGAKIKVNALSTCLPGKCVLSSYSTKVTIDSVFLELADTVGEHTILFRSNVKEVNFELFCTSLGQSASIIVIGELDDPTPISPIPPSETPEGFNQWFDNLNLGSKIGFIIGVAVAGLVILAVIGMLIWFLPEMMLWCHRKRYSKLDENEKMVNQEMDEMSDEVSLTQADLRRMGLNIANKRGISRVESVF